MSTAVILTIGKAAIWFAIPLAWGARELWLLRREQRDPEARIPRTRGHDD